MDISTNDIKESILRAAKHSFLDGKEKELLIKEIKQRLDKHFQIYKPKDYHNDSFRVIDINSQLNSDSMDNSFIKYTNGNEIDIQRKRILKYLTFSVIVGFGSAVLYQSRKKSSN